jgi:hypothetical protein
MQKRPHWIVIVLMVWPLLFPPLFRFDPPQKPVEKTEFDRMLDEYHPAYPDRAADQKTEGGKVDFRGSHI